MFNGILIFAVWFLVGIFVSCLLDKKISKEETDITKDVSLRFKDNKGFKLLFYSVLVLLCPILLVILAISYLYEKIAR